MTGRLDLDDWHRRHHFEFFKDFGQPFFNICADLDVSRLHAATRDQPPGTFFLASLYLSLAAANEIEPFRYRLRDDGVEIWDVIHAGATILRDDETFGFAYFEYGDGFASFAAKGRVAIDRARGSSGPLGERPSRHDMIHYSVIPWVSFTSFAHARRGPTHDSVPKIVFGKHRKNGSRRQMPVSVEVHHALMDGLDVGRLFEHFQALLDEPEQLLEP